MSSTLSDHEKLCEQRYAEVERRLGNVETKLDSMSDTIQSNFRTLTWMIIGSVSAVGTLVGVIVAMIGLAT